MEGSGLELGAGAGGLIAACFVLVGKWLRPLRRRVAQQFFKPRIAAHRIE